MPDGADENDLSRLDGAVVRRLMRHYGAEKLLRSIRLQQMTDILDPQKDDDPDDQERERRRERAQDNPR